MALIGHIAIGMSTNTAKFTSGLKVAETRIQSLASSVNFVSNSLSGAFATLGAGGAIGTINSAVTQASDLAENVGKIGAIFGQQGKAVEADARSMANAFGVSLNGMLDGAGKLGGLFKGAGFSADETAKLSQQFNRLTLDASRFFNVDYATAFQKIRSGLSGEAEPLRDFGVFLTADKIKAQALSMGLADLSGTISDAAKISATAALISNGLADAQGNAAETAGGAAAKMEEFRGRAENLVTTIGEKLTPIAGEFFGGISTGIVAASNAWQESAKVVSDWASTTIGSMGSTLSSTSILSASIGTIADGWQLAGIAFQTMQVATTAGISKIVEGLGYLASGFDSLLSHVAGTTTGVAQYFETLTQDLARLGNRQVDELQKAWSRPWASIGVAQALQKAQQQIATAQAQAANIGKIALSADIASGPAAKAKKPHDVFAGASLFGSKEAASAVLRSKYGAVKDGTAQNTKRTADGIGQLIVAQRETLKAIRERAQGIALEF
jgi:hypothetical protein